MAATVGRKVALTWGGSSISGVRQKGLAIAGAPIDVTSDDDLGWRTLLSDPTVREINISVSGVTKTAALKTDFFNDATTKAMVLTYPDGTTISGTFYMASYKDTGPYADAMTFDAEFQSTGQITYTAGS